MSGMRWYRLEWTTSSSPGFQRSVDGCQQAACKAARSAAHVGHEHKLAIIGARQATRARLAIVMMPNSGSAGAGPAGCCDRRVFWGRETPRDCRQTRAGSACLWRAARQAAAVDASAAAGGRGAIGSRCARRPSLASGGRCPHRPQAISAVLPAAARRIAPGQPSRFVPSPRGGTAGERPFVLARTSIDDDASDQPKHASGVVKPQARAERPAAQQSHASRCRSCPSVEASTRTSVRCVGATRVCCIKTPATSGDRVRLGSWVSAAE